MPRSTPPVTDLEVVDSRWVSPSLIRIEFRSDDLSNFAGSACTDRYVKLMLTDADGEQVLRTYTALDPDVSAGTVAIEFVVHGDSGVAGPWAASAKPGDRITVRGPGGAFTPDPQVDWHLFAGDDTALPAIRQALADLPASARGVVVVEVENTEHEMPLPTAAAVTVTWVHRSDGGTLPDAVRAVTWRPGRVQAFVHGEAQAVMHGIRPYLLRERGLDRADVSISGYWRRGRNEEGFREWKSELAAQESAPSAS